MKPLHLAALLLWTWAAALQAHEVHPQISSSPATVIQLSYANGQPFAFEAYELYPGQGELPAQVGRTDAQGRVVFLPGEQSDWRLKAFSADGHGVDQRLQLDKPGSPITASAPETDRLSRILLGLALILAGFGTYQLLLRRRKST